MLPQLVGRADRVLDGHHGQPRGLGCSSLEPLPDHRGDELHDVRPHGARDDVGLGDSANRRLGVGLRIDRVEAGDRDVVAVVAHLVNHVAVVRVDCVNQLGIHIDEGHVIAGPVQDDADETATDVARTEVHGSHQSFTSLSIAYSSASPSAASSRSTCASSEKIVAIFARISRCPPSLPAMPITKRTSLPSQSIGSG